MRRSQLGVLLIEVLVVVGTVVVLLGAVATTVPRAQEKARRIESINNVRSMAILLSERSIRKSFPPYDGKNFVLSLVAYRIVDIRNPENLQIFFSPGDVLYTLDRATPERFKEVTPQALRAESDFHELTSYAGRRNADRDYLITVDRLKMVVPMICDDDDGPLHHLDGLVMGYTDGSAKFVEWQDLGIPRPEEPDDPEPFLGDEAWTDSLRALASY